MPTFGYEPFGSGRFGRGNWAERVLWGNWPGLWQAEDAKVGGVLQKMLSTWAAELEEMRDKIAAIPQQRDPFAVRGLLGNEEWLYFTSATWVTDATLGPVVVLREPSAAADFPLPLESNPPDWAPYAAISRVAPQWVAQWDGASFRVVNVVTRNYDGTVPSMSTSNEVWLSGVPLGTWPTIQKAVTVGGNEAVATASPTIVIPTAPMRIAPNYTTTVYGASNAGLLLHLTVTGAIPVQLGDIPADPYDGTGTLHRKLPYADTLSLATTLGTIDYERGIVTVDLTPMSWQALAGQVITADLRVQGYYLPFRPVSLLTYLARDYGFENDDNDPESVQRATIAHAYKYFGLKATAESYRIRGAVSGFEVTAQPLHLLEDVGFAALLPAPSVYHVGSKWYTSIEPRALRFDDISSDVLFYDYNEVDPGLQWRTVLDDCFMYETMGNKMSTGLAFALDVVQGFNYPGATVDGVVFPARDPAYITDVTALTEDEAWTYNLSAGYSITVSVLKEAFQDFNWSRKGDFGITVYDQSAGVAPAVADRVWWIDAVVSTVNDPDAAVPNSRWLWTVIVGQEGGDVPVVGDDAAIRYWPDMLATTCGYCRSNRMRVKIEPQTGAWGAETYFGIGIEMDAAVSRLIAKIEKTLVPIHVRVLEYVMVYLTDVVGPVITVVDGIAP